jgi:hypothetical protein
VKLCFFNVQFPIDSLNNIKLQPTKKQDKPLAKIEASSSSSSTSTSKKSKGKSAASSVSSVGASENEVYGVFELKEDSGTTGGEIGEMAEFKCMLPDSKSGSYKLGTYSHHSSLADSISTF